jgi:type III restriction enzyme
MELILQRGLPHQQKAVDAISAALNGVQITSPVQFYENPSISLSDPKLAANIREIQKNIPSEYRSSMPIDDCLNIDIKMETGTGKTYVYTHTIYELHKRYGLNKFIIAVPSLAIKAGTAQFLRDEYVKRHFSDVCGYGTEIEVDTQVFLCILQPFQHRPAFPYLLPYQCLLSLVFSFI